MRCIGSIVLGLNDALVELPACVFPNEVERTYDRSFERFARLVQEDRV